MTLRYRLLHLNGRVEWLDDPGVINIGPSGVLAIYDAENVLLRAVAPGQWLTFEKVGSASDLGADVFSAATREAGAT